MPPDSHFVPDPGNLVESDFVPGSRPPLGGRRELGTRRQSPSRPDSGTKSEPEPGTKSAENPKDTWCTPAWLAEAIGKWDLDPCSNSRSHVRAARRFALEDGDDGLAYRETPLSLRVFVNPPYSRGQVAKWVARYGTRHFAFCFLVRLDPSTAWFRALYRASPRAHRSIAHCRGALHDRNVTV